MGEMVQKKFLMIMHLRKQLILESVFSSGLHTFDTGAIS